MSFSTFFGGRVLDSDDMSDDLQSLPPNAPADTLPGLATPTPEPGLPMDQAKWSRSKARWDTTVRASDEQFVIIYRHFVEKLQTFSPEAVVREAFADHELRKFLNGFVDKNRLEAIHEQQKREKTMYRALIAEDGPFAPATFPAAVGTPAPLPLKLTMMYFGFPVEPMTFTDPLQLSGTGLFANPGFASIFEDDNDDFNDEKLSFVPEELRPLRYLNYYDRKGYGKDNTHMNPEKTYELFYGIPMVVPTHELMDRMRLRGAGANSGSDDANSTTDDVDDDLETEERSTNIGQVSPHIALCASQGDANVGERIYLWGLSGRTTFSYFDAKSFFSAVDRLLSLSKRGDDATSVGITISLLSHPKGRRGPCTVLASDQCFLGRSEQDELNFHKTWLETVQYFDDQIEEGQALDICVAQLSQDIHFSELQEALTYQPSLEDDNVVTVSLSGGDDGTLSYLSMNDKVNGETAASQYQMWFQSLWRMLSRPTGEQLQSYSIGSKQVLAPQSCLVSMTTRDLQGQSEGNHWFHSDVGPTPEAWKSFTDAYQMNGHMEFVLNVIPITDPRASLINVSTGTDLPTTFPGSVDTVRNKLDSQSYWGCHGCNEDAIAFMEKEHSYSPIDPVPLNRVGRPTASGVVLDDFAKGKAFREWSYAHPLSINMQGQQPSLPINAPPIETILKTPGPNGRAAESLPVMSTAVLTPSEQRHLQETVFEMRSLALNRAQPCPFRPCRQHFAIDEDGRTKFREHIQSLHIDKKCPLCEDRSFGYWNVEQKQKHFFENHNYFCSQKDDLYFNTVFKVDSRKCTDTREQAWNFCARCGRDHNKLNVVGDRNQHDNMCFPGLPESDQWLKYCVNCGEVDTANHLAACTKYVPTGPGATAPVYKDTDPNGNPTRPVHCTKCALPTHKLARSYAEKHLARCRGVHNDPAQHCPWCGCNLAVQPRTRAHKHLDECSLKPAAGEGPINTNTGAPLDSPSDCAAFRDLAKARDPELSDTTQVPAQCRFENCTEELSKYNEKTLLEHFASVHAGPTGNLKKCPICTLDFEKREWTTEDEKLGHFRDHVEERRERIKLDLHIADNPNKLDPEVLEAIAKRAADEFSTGIKTNELASTLFDLRTEITELAKRQDTVEFQLQDIFDNVKAISESINAFYPALTYWSLQGAQEQRNSKRPLDSPNVQETPNKKQHKPEDITVRSPGSVASGPASASRIPSDDTGPTGSSPTSWTTARSPASSEPAGSDGRRITRSHTGSTSRAVGDKAAVDDVTSGQNVTDRSIPILPPVVSTRATRAARSRNLPGRPTPGRVAARRAQITHAESEVEYSSSDDDFDFE